MLEDRDERKKEAEKAIEKVTPTHTPPEKEVQDKKERTRKMKALNANYN